MERVPKPQERGERKQELASDDDDDQNVIATAVPAVAVPAAAAAAVAPGVEAHGEPGEEDRLQALQQQIAEAQEELDQQRQLFVAVLGPEPLEAMDSDPVFQDVTTSAFRTKYLEHAAPVVRRIAELRVQRATLHDAMEMARERQEVETMSMADLWERVRRLERRLTAALTALRQQTGYEWRLEHECISDVLLEEQVPLHKGNFVLWSSDSRFIAFMSRPTQSVWVWSMEENAFTEAFTQVDFDDRGFLAWHPNAPLLALLQHGPKPPEERNAQYSAEVRVWDAQTRELRPRSGFVVPNSAMRVNGTDGRFQNYRHLYIAGWLNDAVVLNDSNRNIFHGAEAVLSTPNDGKSINAAGEEHSPCSRFFVFWRTDGPSYRAPGQRFVCVFSVEARSVIFEHPIAAGGAVQHAWDANSRLLLTNRDTTQRMIHTLYSPAEQRVIRAWTDHFEGGHFVIPPVFNVRPTDRYWNKLCTGGAVVDVDDPDLAREVLPRHLGDGHSQCRLHPFISPDGQRYASMNQHVLRVFVYDL